MAQYIMINRPNNMITMVRSKLESPSEDPLTEHEEIIVDLYNKVKALEK